MQGKLIIAVSLAAFGSSAALAAETVRRQGCKIEQQQRQQQQTQSQQPQQRLRMQDCRQQKPIPPVVDPTPWFVL